MALSASPPPYLPSAANDLLVDQLDDDIARVRAEIANLTQKRSLLSASLLSSTKVQEYLRSQNPQPGSKTNTNSNDDSDATDGNNNPLKAVDLQSQHNKTNIHRLAFGITSFPWTDPNPETSNEPLLGIRFDIPSHNGRFDQAPYYIFCKTVPNPKPSEKSSSAATRTTSNGNHTLVPKSLTVHHHTIPAFVPLQDLIDTHLPAPAETSSLPLEHTMNHNNKNNNNNNNNNNSDSDSDSNSDTQSQNQTHQSRREDDDNGNDDDDDDDDDDNNNSPKQNLHALTKEIYTRLLSHSKRKAAINLLSTPSALHPSISSLSSTGEDCRFVRVIWRDGLVGRIKFDDDGQVDKVVVFGDEGRMRDVERLLGEDGGLGRKVYIMQLNERFEEIAKKRGIV